MTWFKSFVYAFRGIRFAFGERNFRLELFATVLVIAAGFFFNISRSEWLVVCICTGGVLAAETFNTAIEKLTDMVSPEIHPAAGMVKDLSAGAVLLCAIASAVAGIIIFLPKIWALCAS